MKETDYFDAFVDIFAERMKIKFRKKLLEGYAGWTDPECKQFMQKSLIEHAQKDDMIDVGVLAVMLSIAEKEGKSCNIKQ